MGVEIAVITKQIMERKDTLDKNGCLNYLYKVLKEIDKTYSHRKYNSEDIKIPKGMKSKIREAEREVEDVLRMKKRDLGQELTKNEEIKAISEWFNISIRRANNIVKAMEVSSIDFSNNRKDEDGNRIDILDSATTSIYMESPFITPLDEYLIKIDRKYTQEALEYLINKKQKRARDCYRALLTLYCIENYKDFEGLYPVLDKQVLEDWQKDGKEPKPYEIYRKYNPKARKKSAEVQASTNLINFLNEIKTYPRNK